VLGVDWAWHVFENFISMIPFILVIAIWSDFGSFNFFLMLLPPLVKLFKRFFGSVVKDFFYILVRDIEEVYQLRPCLHEIFDQILLGF